MGANDTFSVIITEDELPARKLLTRFVELRTELHLDDIARTGREALEKLSSNQYDLLLLDIHLPIISGIEVLEKLETVPYVIFTTAYRDYAVKAFEIGAIDYLHKPFSKERFNQAIDRFLTVQQNNIPYDVYRRREEISGEKYKKSTLKEEKAIEYSNRLVQYMEETKAYTDMEITLNKLAADLNIPPHHLSQVINQQLNKNYYELLNQYRVEAAQKKLIEGDASSKTILDIAFEVGFKSKSAFNAVFKEFTNTTPSQYRKKMKT